MIVRANVHGCEELWSLRVMIMAALDEQLDIREKEKQDIKEKAQFTKTQ